MTTHPDDPTDTEDAPDALDTRDPEEALDALDGRATAARSELADRLDPAAPPIEPLRARAQRRVLAGSAAAVLVVAGLVAGAVALGARTDGGHATDRDVAATTLTTTPGTVRSLRSPVARTTGDPTGIAATVAAENAFATDLLDQLTTSQDGNVFFSPHSVAVALAMTLAGADGETKAQLEEALHLTVPEAAFHDGVNALDQALSAARDRDPGQEEGDPLSLSMSNTIWGQDGFAFLDTYLDRLARSYDAGMDVVDFARNAEAARLAINARVAEETDGKIAELLAPGIIKQSTVLVLVNTILFKASWAEDFDEAVPGPFTRPDGSVVQAPLMGGGSGTVVDGGDWQAAALPYVGGAQMVVVVPDDIDAFTLTPAIVDRVGQAHGAGKITLPKFAITSDLDLKPTLAALGITDLFGPADLSRIDGTRNLAVTDVIHQATIEVDEQGTEAAAATAVVIGFTSTHADPEELVVDRPFVFVIRDTATGAILFAGRVLDPTA